MNLREGLRLTAIAVSYRLIMAKAFSRILRAMLFRVDASDPATFVMAPAALSVVGLLAIYFPSRRAMLVDPNLALRLE
jgi:hypothetical protein